MIKSLFAIAIAAAFGIAHAADAKPAEETAKVVQAVKGDAAAPAAKAEAAPAAEKAAKPEAKKHAKKHHKAAAKKAEGEQAPAAAPAAK